MPVTINITQQQNGIQFVGTGTLNLNSFLGKTQSSSGNANQGVRFRAKGVPSQNSTSFIGIN